MGDGRGPTFRGLGETVPQLPLPLAPASSVSMQILYSVV